MLVALVQHKALFCLQSSTLHVDQGRGVHVNHVRRVSPANTFKNKN